MRRVSSLACILFLLLSLHRAQADEAPAAVEPDAPWYSKLTAEIPFPLEKATTIPPGFNENSLKEPYHLVYSLRRAPEFSKASFILDANLSFPRHSLAPAVGITPGMSFSHKSVHFEAALDIQDQQLVDRSPFKVSQYDVWITSLLISLRSRLNSYVSIGARARYAMFLDGELGGFEGLSTEIEHESSMILSPWITLHLPLGFDLSGQMDLIALGATAIASKDFAVGIQSQGGTRLGIMLARRFGPLGLEVSYRSVRGFEDVSALPYQAPFYYRDHLLSPQSVTLGVSCYL